MRDIPQELRDAAVATMTCYCDDPKRCGCRASVELLNDAAAEIERLRAALKEIADWPGGRVFSAGFSPDDAEEMQDSARHALKDEQTRNEGD